MKLCRSRSYKILLRYPTLLSLNSSKLRCTRRLRKVRWKRSRMNTKRSWLISRNREILNMLELIK